MITRFKLFEENGKNEKISVITDESDIFNFIYKFSDEREEVEIGDKVFACYHGDINVFFEVEDYRTNQDTPLDKNTLYDENEPDVGLKYLFEIGNSYKDTAYNLGYAYIVVKLETVKRSITYEILDLISPILSEDEIKYYKKFIVVNRFNI
jgi:signal peptidase I